MTESSIPWGGTVTGDAVLAPYSDDQWSDMYRKLLMRDHTVQGVVGGYANELEVIDAGGTTMRVSTGIALVDGKFYENTVVVDNASAGNTVYWLVGLQKDFAGQEVRVFTRGTYASEAAALAALVQDPDPAPAIWEIPLATVLTDAAGNVDVVTDQRAWVLRLPVQRLFVPCVAAFNFTDTTDIVRGVVGGAGAGWPFIDNKDSDGYGDFVVPLDCKSGSDLILKAVIQPRGTGNIYRYIFYTIRQGCGEALRSIQAGAPAGVEAVASANYTYCIAETTIPAAEPGWFYSLHFGRPANTEAADTISNTVNFLGFIIDYTPIVP
ncbi:hypothetical protein LCGC14_1427550 [marine sediment metagenome]|uniref:Uncharacterized protein n=1 Tax=marine sediment metagenome TaxID=412755 RepID=A0A0F9JPV7_9ZZZZ